MNEIFLIFWDHLLKNNIVLISLVGVLIIISEDSSLSSSFKNGLIMTAAFSFSILSAWIFSYYTAGSIIILPAVFFVNTLLAICFINKFQLLNGTWLGGLTKRIAILPALMGIQFKIVENAVYNYQDIIFILAAIIGFYLIYIITAAVKEQLLLKENNKIFKTEYLLLLFMAFLSAVMSGYNFIN